MASKRFSVRTILGVAATTCAVVAGLIAALAYASGSSPSFTFSSDEDGITWSCRLDSGATSACTSPKDVTGLAPGPHTMRITGSFTVPNPSPSGTVLLGNQTVQSVRDGGSAPGSEAFGFTASDSGTATSLSVYLDSTDGAQVALYADSAGKPAARLDTATVSSNAAGWTAVPLTGGVNITAGTRYWIAVGSKPGGTISYRDVGSSGSNLDWSGTGFPDPYVPENRWSSDPISAYVSGDTSTTTTTSTTPTTTTSTTSTTPTTTTTTSTSTTTSTGGGSGFRSLTWYAGWECGSAGDCLPPPGHSPWDGITDVVTFGESTDTRSPFVDTTSLGLSPTEQQGFVAAAHAAGKRIELDLNGDAAPWAAFCDPANRATGINTLISEMQRYHYDGLDIDMEHDPPTWGSMAEWVACMDALHAAAMNVTTAAGNVPYLNIDGVPDWEQNAIAAVQQDFDTVLIMGYGSSCNGSADCPELAHEIGLYTNAGVPLSKIMFGQGLDSGPSADDPRNCGLEDAYLSHVGAAGTGFYTMPSGERNGAWPCFDTTAQYVQGS